MSKHHSFIETVDQVLTDAVKKGIMHLSTEDTTLSSNKITVSNKQLINFGSCSYLGLEFDPRLIDESQRAIRDYGTQFSASRAYMSIRHYEELENLFCQIFQANAIAAPTTTLAHMGVIPILVGCDDAVILDHQVHNSVQTAVKLVKANGVHVELLRHNRMDRLEERIKYLRQKHRKIWYMADGVYSMYGDTVPVGEVYSLMDKYPELHFYVDDAHGMSVFGKNGGGYVLSQKPIRDRMVFTTSLAKAFATGGAVIAFKDPEIKRKVRTCAASLVTSGPIQPAVLGAAIASSKIHLSDEIYEMQEDLQQNIKYTNLMLKKYGLPNVAETNTPVFFVGVSLPKLGYNIIDRMMNEGYYLNHGIFPGVSIKNTGVRFTITRLHTFEQIENMVAAMAHHYPLALEETGFTMEKVYKAFKMTPPEEKIIEKKVSQVINKSHLTPQFEKSIKAINTSEWDDLLGSCGSFDSNGLTFLESSFCNNEEPENNWDFDYVVIRDDQEKVVLATFLTCAINKDDMLAPASVSEQIEVKRLNDPYYLSSKTLFLGSMFTEGNHLYVDRKSPYWKEAMSILFERINKLQEEYKATVTTIRDLNDNDEELDAIFVDNGFFKFYMPDNHDIDISWETPEDYLSSLSYRSRKHLRQDIIRHKDKYELKLVESFNNKDVENWYDLYLNVKNRSLALNTFTLPYKLFENMASDPGWEIFELHLKEEFSQKKDKKPVAVMFTYVVDSICNFMLIGIDYTFQKEFKCYKQALYQVIMHAKKKNYKKVNLGFAASFEKRKLGANTFTPVAYMQTRDNYNMEVIGSMSVLQKAGKVNA